MHSRIMWSAFYDKILIQSNTFSRRWREVPSSSPLRTSDSGSLMSVSASQRHKHHFRILTRLGTGVNTWLLSVNCLLPLFFNFSHFPFFPFLSQLLFLLVLIFFKYNYIGNYLFTCTWWQESVIHHGQRSSVVVETQIKSFQMKLDEFKLQKVRWRFKSYVENFSKVSKSER